jgi:hypothetical protein
MNEIGWYAASHELRWTRWSVASGYARSPHNEPVEAPRSHDAAAHRACQGCGRCKTAHDECDRDDSGNEYAGACKAHRDDNGEVIGRDQDRTSFRFGCDAGFDRHVLIPTRPGLGFGLSEQVAAWRVGTSCI